MEPISTRRFELGLPLFAGLDLGQIIGAQVRLAKGDFAGLSGMVETLGKAGQLRVIRKLAAIWTASEIEVRQAEARPEVMAELEERAAEKPFTQTFQDAMAFQSALWDTLGVSPASSETMEPTATKGENSDGSLSGG